MSGLSGAGVRGAAAVSAFLSWGCGDVIALGAETRWGRVEAVGCREGERYYMVEDRAGVVALMPAVVVEEGGDGGEAVSGVRG